MPHAGWVFSGELAATAFKAIQQANGQVDTFVIFGAAHRYFDGGAVVYDSGTWQTPLGQIEIDAELAAEIVAQGAVANPDAHRGEHSIEVQVPFIQYLFPKAKIVPIIVPVAGFDHSFGAHVGQLIVAQTESSHRVCCFDRPDSLWPALRVLSGGHGPGRPEMGARSQRYGIY